MIRLLKLASCLVVVQVVVFFLAWLLVGLINPNCNYTTGAINCSHFAANYLYSLPLMAFAVMPPLIVKFAADRTRRKLQWKRLIITHLLAGLAVYTTAIIYIATTVHMSGA